MIGWPNRVRSGATGTTAKMASAGTMASTGPRTNTILSTWPGMISSLKIILTRVGDRLAQAELPGPVGTIAQLEAADQLALEQRQVGEAGQQHHDQDDRLDGRDDDQVDPIHRFYPISHVPQVRLAAGAQGSRRALPASPKGTQACRVGRPDRRAGCRVTADAWNERR